MPRMLSVQIQCCCCSASVFSALFGTIMAATGISLVLNYRITEVDTGGLPPELQNDEGKKIVGIILICCGFGSMGISAIIATVYFTVCSRQKASVRPVGEDVTKKDTPTNSTGAPQSTSTDPYSSAMSQRLPGTKGSNSRHGKRQKKKRTTVLLKPYKSRLAPHQEVSYEGETRHVRLELNESPRSLDSSQTESSKSNSISTQGEMPEVNLKTVSENPAVHIKIHEPSIEEDTSNTSTNDDYSVDSPRTDSDKFTPAHGDLDGTPIELKHRELPALARVQAEEEDEEDFSQIEEVKQLDRDVVGHMMS